MPGTFPGMSLYAGEDVRSSSTAQLHHMRVRKLRRKHPTVGFRASGEIYEDPNAPFHRRFVEIRREWVFKESGRLVLTPQRWVFLGSHARNYWHSNVVLVTFYQDGLGFELASGRNVLFLVSGPTLTSFRRAFNQLQAE